MPYAQFCGLARALDVVGDRWTLLIVRELLAGARRYGDIRAGLPGIATNLLADRLRRLEADGVCERTDDGYRLTDRGEALRPVVRELVRWSTPLMADGPGDDAFHPRWLLPALDALVGGGGDGRLNVAVDGYALHVDADGGSVDVGAGRLPHADAEVVAEASALLGVVAGELRLADARRAGAVRVDGDLATARRVLEPRRRA